MRRSSSAVAGLASLLLLPAVATTAAAAPPRMYHNVNVESASFDSLEVDGCLKTELFVSATSGHWAGRHGPSVKQDGPTGVFVRVTDVCAAEGMAAAAAGPGGAVVLEVEASSMSIPLVTDQKLSFATASGTLDGTDQDGAPVTVGLDVRWTAAGPLQHTTGSSHTRYPDGNVSGAANEWTRETTATATVTLDGHALGGVDAESLVQRVKSHCIEVPTGSTPPEDFFPCLGFPG